MPLTLRERQVLAAYIVLGRTAAAASSLHITQSTVKGHLSAIYRKTGTHSAVQALWKMGYIDPAAVQI
jgi:two-component system response regulator DesR